MTAIRALRHIDSDDMPWRRQAACIATGPATFYPERDGNDVVADIVRAKVICASCPVQADCLQHALDQLEQYGIWGGMTWEERRSLRRKRRRGERAAAGPMPRRIVDAPVHNYSTYCNRGCRCEVCTEGMRTWRELRHG